MHRAAIIIFVLILIAHWFKCPCGCWRACGCGSMIGSSGASKCCCVPMRIANIPAEVSSTLRSVGTSVTEGFASASVIVREKMSSVVSAEYFAVNANRTVVLIYAEWCGACKGFRPTWDELKSTLAGTGVAFKEIDGDKEKVKVVAYPTIEMIDEWGNRHTFTGMRTLTALQRWISSPIPNQFD